jgi:hypothetical protein
MLIGTGDAPLLATRPATLLQVGERVLCRPRRGEPLWLDLESGALLETARRFAPLAAHAADAARRYGISEARATAVYTTLRERGLLCDGPALLAEAARAPRPTAPLPLLAIRTWHRSFELERLLASLLDDEARHDVVRRYVVIDDGTERVHTQRAETLARDFAARTRSAVHYLGPPQRAAIRAAIDPGADDAGRRALAELVDPAFPTGYTGARSWNLAVLAAIGGTVSVLDDDLVFPIRRHPATDHRIAPRDSTLSRSYFFDDDRYDALPLWPGDVYADLAGVVGQQPAHLADRHGVDWSMLAGRGVSEILPLLHGGPVLAAYGGNYGGLTRDSTIDLAWSDDDTLADLWRPPGDLVRRLDGERTSFGVDRLRLTSYAWYSPLMTDCRDLVPFIGTWARGDDTYFLAALTAIVDAPAYAYTPALTGHFPPEQRGRLDNACERVALRDLNANIAHVIALRRHLLHGSDRATRLAALGALLGELGDGSDTALAMAFHGVREDFCAHLLPGMRGALERHPQGPPAWRALVERMIAANLPALDRTTPLPFALDTARKALAQFARLAPLWPAVHAKLLREPLLDKVAPPLRG